ncbi:Pkinase-domain-containing protein [Macrolepiota fuliginosa MF-IS2]|uniref:Serine/threonine-protein kinase n=1 Tax=Macrolepiota fuliginosa MF-IS2 TaxID=1400762 RepID=A0A9P5XHR8_9AGAR|nr:Pkinase-domain-containing protein [Macrolepiota fuliginosa MF-IS2]
MNIDYRRRVAVMQSQQVQPQLQPQRRHPLTTTNNVQQTPQAHQQTPPKPPPKGASPPLPRQNSKTTPPTPPKVIVDRHNRFQFTRVGFLGEGGFARVFEVKDSRDTRLACKVITKTSLKTKKAKTKLWAEIKIHRSLEHPNIVRFHDCFEDGENVYMTLELCPSGSLMDMLRRRRRFTEPEARYFMVQLIGACHYMHTHQVIHRDLKLGNLLLDANMNIKVADFGLAALIENPGERKKTICGTPNYIAPEVLFDTVNGHSFEVDTWSIGVILYTLIIGRPPFQTKDVKEIYKRIRDNEYEFPIERKVGSAAKTLIQQILTPDPALRPTLHEILDHFFFTQGPVPSYIPSSAHDFPPDFSNITAPMSENNLRRLRRFALLDQGSNMGPSNSGTLPQSSSGKTMTSTIQQQEKEFQKAIQPGSPISALLSSARQPLVMGVSQSPSDGMPSAPNPKESALLRKLQAAKESPLRRNYINADDGQDGEEDKRARKELEAQKARIVAQMAPVREEPEEEEGEEAEGEPNPLAPKEKYGYLAEKLATVSAPASPPAPAPAPRPLPQIPVQKERVALGPARTTRENIPAPSGFAASALTLPKSESVVTNLKGKGKERIVSGRVEKENVPTASAIVSPSGTVKLDKRPDAGVEGTLKLNGFDAAAQVLTSAFEAKAAGRVFRDYSNTLLEPEKVFIVSWVDYCNKYGMGYALTDGSVGVYFNDSTSCVLSPDKVHFDYITSRHHGNAFVRKSYTTNAYPEDLKSKVYLLKSFEGYIMDRLFNHHDYVYQDTERTKGMEWVHKYLRMKHVIVFKLSHDVLQFNFYDHSKLILSSHGLLITHIDKNYKITRHTLSDVMALSLDPSANPDPEQVRFNQKLVDKLKYCKEVLVSIKEASAGVTAKQSQEQVPPQPERMPLQAQQQERVDRVQVPAQKRAEVPLGAYTNAQQHQGLAARASRMTLR